MSASDEPRTSERPPVEIVAVPGGGDGVALLAGLLPAALAGERVVALVPAYAGAGVRATIRQAVTPVQGSMLPPGAAIICPTSGSTGRPRGVVLTAEQIRGAARVRDEAQGGPSAWLLGVPPVTAPALAALARARTAEAPVASWRGAGVGGFDPASFIADARALLAAAEAAGLRARTSVVAAQLRLLLLSGDGAADTLARFDSVLVGGGPTSPSLAAQAAAAGVRLVRTYGMTETFGGCVYDGLGLPGVSIRIDRPGPDGVGQVLLGGPMLAGGYTDGPLRLIHGLLATGDRGRLVPAAADGATDAPLRLELSGRGDDVVTVGGANVDVAAVAQAVGEHPGIADCAVVPVAAQDGGHRLVAFVVPVPAASDGAMLNADDLAADLRSAVGDVLGRAARPEVRVVPALPLLPGGKVDHQRLVEEESR